MKKYLGLIILIVGFSYAASCQTLFSYGSNRASKQSFLAAFSKNPPKKENRRTALDEYLNLYINYKLKVQAGYDEQLDKQPSFEQESRNFKKQIAENVINEEVGIKALTQQAVERSEKDIRVSQVFVEINPKDTAKAWQQINAAYTALKAGKPFGVVAATFSTDTTAKITKGDIGYVTAFTLGYNFENQIFALKAGTYSKPYRSSFGYHIFKNMGERPAVGKRKVAQILIAMPPNAVDSVKRKYAIIADTIYNKIKKGEAFEKMSSEYSNDYKTAYLGGVIGEVGVGDYDSVFEKKVFAMQNVGDVSKPFETVYGYHILKLLDKKLVNKDVNDAGYIATVKQQVERDERLAINKKNALNRWLQVTKYTQAEYDAKAFKQYTDSNLLNKITNGIKNISDTTVLFTFEKKKIYAADWAVWASKNVTTTALDYSKSLKEFVDYNCTQYYTDYLDLYSEPMQEQCKEFDEANVLFAAMDKHVWGKASEDVEGLKGYYSAHKDKYQWSPSISGLIVSCKTKEMATEIASKLKQNPSDWHNITTNYGTDVNADSSRYEISQLPIKQPIISKAGFISTPEKNTNDDGYTFVYVLNPHNSKENAVLMKPKGW